MQSFSVTSKRACLHGDWARQIGEVTCRGSPHLLCKRDQLKMRDHMDRLVTTPNQVTSPTWGPPPPCKQALNPVKWQSMATGLFIAAAWANLKRTNEAALWSAKNYIIGASNHFFLPNARNCGYARMKDLGCAIDSQGIVDMCKWKI